MESQTTIYRDGTSQKQRGLVALSPESVSVEERDIRDWIEFIRQYTSLLNFYDEKNKIAGDWSGLLKDITTDELIALAKNPQQFLQQSDNIERFRQPHLALLLTFLQLLRYPQQQFKQFTQRHLDFYYQQVLRLATKPSEPDHVYVTFQLVSGKKQYCLRQGTLLDAGQDNLGNQLHYALDQDVDLSAAQIGAIKTIYIDQDEIGKIQGIYPDTVYDRATQKPLTEQGFSLFGKTKTAETETTNDPTLGFAIASPLLHLEGGIRQIWLILSCLPHGVYKYKEIIDKFNKEQPFVGYLSGIEQAQTVWSAFTTPDLVWNSALEPLNQFSYPESCRHLSMGYEYGKELDCPIDLPLTEQDAGKFLVCPISVTEKQKQIYIIILVGKSLKLVYLQKTQVDKSSGDQLQLYPYNVAHYELQFMLELNSTLPSIKRSSGALSCFNISKDYPTLALLIKAMPDESYYEVFRHIQIDKFGLFVNVNGLENLVIANDTFPLNSQKPFQPFGALPHLGSSFYFTHPELCGKKLEYLTLQVTWSEDCPKDFQKYYLNYPPEIVGNGITNDSFKVQLIRVQFGQQQPINGPVPLFSAKNQFNIDFNSKDQTVAQVITKDNLIQTTSNNPVEYPVYYKIELQGIDFQHQNYARCLTAVALENALVIKNKKDTNGDKNNDKNDDKKDFKTINPPYTPLAKQAIINYSATSNWISQREFMGEMAHIYPFGWKSAITTELFNKDQSIFKLLPDFDQQGYLFIGIENIQTPQNLSLLFRLGMRQQKNEVSWYCLNENTWHPLQYGKEVIADGTLKLSNTGIIEFFLDTPSNSNTLLPAGYYWLMATISDQKKQKGCCYAIETNAAAATFVSAPNNSARESMLLPVNTIKGLLKYDSAIKNVTQPDCSFLGKLAEDPARFNIRVSERLRHKQRALTVWDYEHLVLEQFPEVYKVKCLSSQDKLSITNEAQITLVIIPRREYSIHPDALRPEAPMWLLEYVRKYIQAYTSPWVTVNVKNPEYQIVHCYLNIYLNDFGKTYYRQTINESIIRYLSPWRYDEQADISFCSRIYASAVTKCVEALPFVDYVKSLQFSCEDSDGNDVPNNSNNDDESVEVFGSDVVLVSDNFHSMNLFTQGGKEYD